MEIDKIWWNNKEKEHSIIVFAERTLYRVKAVDIEFQDLKNKLNRGVIDDKFIGIPLGYMKSIELWENGKALIIKYGKDSEDQLLISSNTIREEIFDFIKSLNYFKKYSHKKPSTFQRIKKPLIALLVVLGVFTYIYVIISGLNQGYEYETRGGNPGLGGVVLIFAHLGLQTNILIFGPLAALAMYRIYVKFQEEGVVRTLSNKT